MLSSEVSASWQSHDTNIYEVVSSAAWLSVKPHRHPCSLFLPYWVAQDGSVAKSPFENLSLFSWRLRLMLRNSRNLFSQSQDCTRAEAASFDLVWLQHGPLCFYQNSCHRGITTCDSVPLSSEEGPKEQFFSWLLPLEYTMVKKKKKVSAVLLASQRLVEALLWLHPAPVLGSGFWIRISWWWAGCMAGSSSPQQYHFCVFLLFCPRPCAFPRTSTALARRPAS